MGLIRKVTAISTLGVAASYRSDKEKLVRAAQQSGKGAKAQGKLAKTQEKLAKLELKAAKAARDK